MTKAPKLRVCEGKSCKKKKAARFEILETLADDVRVEKVRCQKICSGPVVGLKVSGTLEWFADMDSPKAVAALQALVRSGEMGKPLEKRRVPKRSGRLKD
jgi:(2Fe-2S) ferredoxin